MLKSVLLIALTGVVSCGVSIRTKKKNKNKHANAAVTGSSKGNQHLSAETSDEERALEYFLPSRRDTVVYLKGYCEKAASWDTLEFSLTLYKNETFMLGTPTKSGFNPSGELSGKFESDEGTLTASSSESDFTRHEYMSCMAGVKDVDESIDTDDIPVLDCAASNDPYSHFLFSDSCSHIIFALNLDLKTQVKNDTPAN